MGRFGSIGTQYFDNAGNPLIDGFIQFLDSGTDTDKDTFADVNLSKENANPVPLSAAGRQPNIFFNGSARGILFNSAMEQIEERDPLGGETEEGVFSDWNSITIYNQSSIVVGSDGLFYLSIANANQDNDPVTDPVNWSEIRFIRLWNPNETYLLNRVVQASDGLFYTSLINNNLNNDPVTDLVNWKPSVESTENNLTNASVTDYAYNNFTNFN